MEKHRVQIDESLFWARLEKFEGCWFFDGVANRYGIYVDEHGFRHVAHRLSYTLVKGPIPFGYVILHVCDTPGCCNPEHLTADTHSQNMRDKVVKGRTHVPVKPEFYRPKPATKPRPIVVAPVVRHPRKPNPLGVDWVAKYFSVTRQTVYNWIHSGQLKATKTGRQICVTEEAVEEFIQRPVYPKKIND